jgi:hypothetical protein
MKTYFAWFRAIAGVALLLWGLRWVLVGVDMISDSNMSGEPAFAALGLACAVLGGWLVWPMLRWLRHPQREA